MLCRTCHAESLEGARFCSQCGTSLGTSEPEHDHASADEAEPERRQLTIVFIDLVDSTRIAARLDPEEWRSIAQDYQRVCARAVEAFGGHVAQFLGDGLLCYFGYPAASERDAENALRAALAMLEEVAGLSPLVEGKATRLRARVGIHTGPVVVGEIGGGRRRETLAIGTTTNLAARLQTAAEPNRILISAATERIVRGRFVLEPFGDLSLKGITHPVTTYEVAGAAEPKSRLDLAASKLTPFTGRARDLQELVDRWELAAQEQGQAMLISGDAGIGKSRLLRTLRDRVIAAGHTWLECRAAPYAHEKALHSVIELMQRSLGFRSEHSAEARLGLLEQGLHDAGVLEPDGLTLMAALLSLPLDSLPEPEPATPAQRRRASLETLADWVLGLARRSPVILALEDLQWMDPSTLEWIEVLVARHSDEPLMILGTQRPQALPEWAERPEVFHLEVATLQPAESQAIVDHMARRAGVDAHLLADIPSRTDGNPLYIEELVNAVLATRALDDSPSDPNHGASSIPGTLQDSLMARLDAAGVAKEAAQLAACLGREFRFDVLDAVWQKDALLLRACVDRLVSAGLLFRRSEEVETYLFKHALIRDCAYESLLMRRRKQIHAQIAETLATQFEDMAASQPELMAHHYTEAAQPDQAVDFLCKAGLRERERFAFVEAAGHLERALEMLATLRESQANDSKELEIRMSLGRLLSSTEGYGADELRANAARIGELCENLGESPEIFPALFEQWSFYMGQENPERMEAFAVKLLSLANRMGDRGLQVETELAMGMTQYLQGRIEECVAHTRSSVELYDVELDRHHATVYGLDPCVISLAIGGAALVYSGYLDEAIEWHERAQTLATQLDHPYTSATSKAWFASTLNHRRDYERALQLAHRSLELAQEGGYKLMATGAFGHVAGALIGLGRLEEGAELAIESSRGFEECNSRLASLTPIVHLARARLLQGDIDGGLETTARSRALLNQGVDPQLWPETLRLEAELLLSRSSRHREEAEACLREAIEKADQQGSRFAALASAVSLARVLQGSDRSSAGRALLAPRFAWFSEGLDTPLLREASDLLSKL